MQLIENGPDIPPALFEAQDEQRLAIFCGAGVSAPSGLPLFKELVDGIYRGLGTERDDLEHLEYERENYERVLGLLERDHRFSRAQIVGEVRRLLAPPAEPDLSWHKAILDLGTDAGGGTHVVTTNFDTLFEIAAPTLTFHAAPALPIPKPPKWNALVYLHGRLGEVAPEGDSLVLSAADFGLAYLIERWASHFISELFAHFVVLFVGYGVNDPVMRYLVDAIAAERRRGRQLGEAFAFAPLDPQGIETTRQRWVARNVSAIPYECGEDHRLLRDTLVAWASIWRGGLTSRLDIVNTIGTSQPGAQTPERVSRLCWALADRSGSMAARFAELGTEASLEWLPLLEKEGLLTLPAGASPQRAVSLVEAYPPDSAGTGSLDQVRLFLAKWLASHVGNPELVRWVVRKGGHLHPLLARLIKAHLSSVIVAEPLRRIWTALCGAVQLQSTTAFDDLQVLTPLEKDPWSATLRVLLLKALSPRIAVRTGWSDLLRRSSSPAATPIETEPTVAQLISFECETAAGPALQMIVERLKHRDDADHILADLAFDLTSMLRGALDMMAILDGASADYDISYMDHPSIAPHEQNHFLHGWSYLIECVRMSFDVLLRVSPPDACALARSWARTPYPLFRRLAFYAARTSALTPEEMLHLVLGDTPRWLWSVRSQVELFSLLPHLWKSLDKERRRSLVRAILVGPPGDLFVEGLPVGERQELQEQMVWERLARIDKTGPKLYGEGRVRLRRLVKHHPEWQLSGTWKDDFPIWTESFSGHRSDFSPEELLARGDEDLVRILVEHEQNREGLLDAWGLAACKDPNRSLRLLGLMLDRGMLDAPILAHALGGLDKAVSIEPVARAFLDLIMRTPDALLDGVVWECSYAIRTLAEQALGESRLRLLSVWDRLLTAANKVKSSAERDRLSVALNHPAGVLSEALLRQIQPRQDVDHGIPLDVRGRLERLLLEEAEASRLGRVIIASRLGLLSKLDADWVRSQLIPHFSWSRPDEATGTWQGYLWSPWVHPSLWAALKPHFLESFNHVGSLGDASRHLASLLASVAIDGQDLVSHDEARRCLRGLDHAGRAAIAFWISRKVLGAGDRAPTLWVERIGPWLNQAWPREPGLRSGETAEKFAWAVMHTHSVFPGAVEDILPILCPIERGHIILDGLMKQGIVADHPASALALVRAITPDDPTPWYGPLSAFLRAVEGADPGVRSRRDFLELSEIALKRQL